MSTVYDILQDRNGYIWIATEDGLNRFDGYSVNVYRHDPDQPNSLSSNDLRVLYEDRAGFLWIGTSGEGLDRYDPVSMQFTHYNEEPADPNSLRGDRIHAIIEDHTGILWIATQAGLNRFDPTEGAWTTYRSDPDDPTSLSSDDVLSIFEDSSGEMWVGTTAGLDLYDRDFDLFMHFRSDPADPNSLSGRAVTTILEDHLEELWIGTSDGGLNRFDRQTGRFVHFKPETYLVDSLSSNVVTTMVEDAGGYLWIGTDQGLNRYDREKEAFVHFQPDPEDPFSLGDDDIHSLFVDQAGGLWVGTAYGGVDRFNPLSRQFEHYAADPSDSNGISNNSIWTIWENASGTLWLGTNGGGLNRYDPDEGIWQHFRSEEGNPYSLSNDVVMAVYEDGAGVLWIGTWGGGLNRFDPETEQFTHYRNDPEDPHSLSSDVVWLLLEDRTGALWIGTAAGLNRFDRDSGQFTRFLHDTLDPNSISGDPIGAIYEDRSGVLWVGTHYGLNRFDRDTESFSRYLHDPDDLESLSHDIVFAILEDRDGALWIGTYGGGLNKLDRNRGSFTHYRVSDGLANDSIYGILADEEGNLWISTNNGLSCFEPHTETFRNFDVGDGLQASEFNFNAYFKNARGEMFFGGVNGLNRFHPRHIAENPVVPPVVLTSISQGGEPVIQDRAFEYVTDVTLRWPGNYFDFEFATLNYFQPERNQYAYMLEGFEKEWNYIGTRRFGRYTNLPGGTYNLRMKGSNNDGVWNEAGASVQIRVVPPIWDTWTFRGVLVLVLVAGLIGGYRLRIRNVEAHSRVLETQVANRTKELTALNQISAAVSQSLDLKGTLDDALEKTIQVMGVDGAGIYLLDPVSEVLTLTAQRGLDDALVERISRVQVGEGFSDHAIQTGEPLTIQDLAADPRFSASAVQDAGMRSLAVTSLSSKGEILGTLFVVSRHVREFEDQEISLLTSIGLQIGVAVENAGLFEDTKNRLAQLAALQETNQAIVSTLELDTLLNRIVQQATTLLKGGGGILNLVDWEKEEDEVVACTGSATFIIGSRASLDEGLSGWVSRHNQPLISNQLRDDPRTNRRAIFEMPDAPLQSIAIAPLTIKEKVFGTLVVIDKAWGEEDFNQGDLDLLTSFANQAATAIENARLYADEKRSAEQFRVISEVGRRLTQLLEVDEVLHQVAEAIQGAFGYYHVGIGLIEGDEVVYRVGAGELWDSPDFRFKPARLKIGQEGITGWVAASGEALLVPDVLKEPRYVPMVGSATRSELTVPIAVKGQVIGVLDAQSDRSHAFDETDLVVVQSLAHLAGTAIDNARLYQQAQQLGVVEERQRLARELHDSVTQALYGITLYSEAMGRHLAVGQVDMAGEQLSELRSTAQEALREMRLLIFQLRPPDLEAEGLVGVLRTRLEAVEARAGLKMEFNAPEDLRLPLETEEGLYRIAQEALNNILKHAFAQSIHVSLTSEPGKVTLEIADDGVGFDPLPSLEGSGLGLDGMYERAAEMGADLTIESKPGEGARLRVEVPR